MRSTQFVVLSILLHSLCVAALVLAPRTLEPEVNSNTVEVKLGEPAEQAGEATAPQVKAPAAPVEQKPAVQKPTVKKVAAQKSIAKKVAPITIAAPTPSQESEDSEAPQIPEEAALTPIVETTPVGVEAATEEAPVEPEAAPVANTAPAEEAGPSTKGGATKGDAVSYLDLKQLPGNRLPTYPMQARLENRQGLLELLYRVTREGTVTDVQVVKSSGSKDLDDSAVAAISTYKFVSGQEGWARHPVVFSLKGDATSAASRLRVKSSEHAQVE